MTDLTEPLSMDSSPANGIGSKGEILEVALSTGRGVV
jgi:hypothetical protein